MPFSRWMTFIAIVAGVIFRLWKTIWLTKHFSISVFINCRSSRPEVFLGKGVLKLCNKFTGKHPCQSVIAIKLLKQLYLNHISAWVFSCKFAAYFHKPFPKNTSGRLFLVLINWLVHDKRKSNYSSDGQ